MPNKDNFSWSDPKIVLHTTYAGILYFFLLALFAVLNYEGMFFMDGTSVVFQIANYQWFPSADQREVMYLGQLLPVSFALAGLKLKWIMIGYILNIYLFYFILFLVTTLVFKDALAAILLLLLHYKGVPYNHFFTAEEILPGIYLLVVLISLIRNFNALRYPYLGYGAILLLLLFIIQSHPLVLACLGGSIIILGLSNPNLFTLHRNVIVSAFIIIIALLGLKILHFNNHDVLLLRAHKSFYQSLVQLLHPVYLSEMTLYLFYTRKIFTLVFGITIVYLFIMGRYKALTILLGLTFMTTVLFNMQVVHTNFRVYELSHEMYDWWSLPVRFVAFTAFCLLILQEISTKYIYKVVRLCFLFYFSIGSLSFLEQHTESRVHIAQARLIIDKCQELGVNKAYIKLDELPLSTHNNAFLDILILSALENPDSAIQVVYIKDDEDIEQLANLQEDEMILQDDSPAISDDYLNDEYFDIEDGQYILVSLE